MSVRIQRRHDRGWRMPPGAVYVGKGSKWWPLGALAARGDGEETIRRELAGHDLACWCPLDAPCHADVLLRIAEGQP